MVFTKSVAFVLGVLLAVLEAVQQMLGLSSNLHDVITMAVVFLGVLGVQALDPAAIAAKIPQHLALLASAAIGALEVFLHTGIHTSHLVHAIIGFVIVLAATLGIKVVSIPLSMSARKLQASRNPAVPAGGSAQIGSKRPTI